ncbi:hypothetical protein K439DRAFT_1615447 [Ramaria rubella]|nr:hypothetical protein K439DRAFT_1615447 [Ramaria rubella]
MKYLEGDGCIDWLVHPLCEFYNTQMSSSDGDMGDSMPLSLHMMEDVGVGNEELDKYASESSSNGTDLSVDSNNQEDHLDADVLTDLNYSMQQITTADNEIGICLPTLVKPPAQSPRSIWQESHAPPKDLPLISTLFEALNSNAQSQSASQEFSIWSVATSALKPTAAPWVGFGKLAMHPWLILSIPRMQSHQ